MAGSLGSISTEESNTVTALASPHTISEGGNLARCVITGRSGVFPVSAMIDTGNDTRPDGVVMSLEFIKDLGLEMIPVTPTRVNTASKKASMTVVGRVKDVRIVLMDEYIVHSVLVLEGLSHPVNIGLEFLQQHYATICLTPESVTLQLGDTDTKMNLVKKNSVRKPRQELDLIQKRGVGQEAAVTRTPNVKEASGPDIKKASRLVKKKALSLVKKALGQEGDSDLVQRRAPISTVESASGEGAPSSVSKSRESEPRMRDPEKAVGQDEDSDLVQRRASNIKEYLLIDPTLKVDTNVVDQVEIIVNNDVVNDLNSNIDIVDNIVTSLDVNVVGELLPVSRSHQRRLEAKACIKAEKKAKVEKEKLARLDRCRIREEEKEAKLDKCNNSPPDIGHDDIESPKSIKSPKRVLLKELDFPSKFSSKYRCKIVGRKKHKKRYFYKINPSSNLVRVEMIATLAPTLHSTLIPPNLLVPVELQFFSKKGHVGVIPEQRVLGDRILMGGGVLPESLGKRQFKIMTYVSNTTEADIMLPAGTHFTIKRGTKHYMYLPKSMGQVVPGTTLQEQAKNSFNAEINALQAEFLDQKESGIIIQHPVKSQLGSKLIPEEEFVNMILEAESCPDFQDLIFRETMEQGIQEVLVGFNQNITAEENGDVGDDVFDDVGGNVVDVIGDVKNDVMSDVRDDVVDVSNDVINDVESKVASYAQVGTFCAISER